MAWNALTQMQPLMRAAGMRELDERGSDLALARAASQRVADALLRGAGGAALPDVVIAPNWFGDTSRSLIALSPLSAHAFASTLLAASTPRVPGRYSRGAPDWRRWRLSPHQRVSRCWGVYSIANKVRLVETIQAARAAAVLPLLRSHADGDGDGSGGGGGSGLLPESYVWREFSHRPDWRALLGPAEGALLPPRRWLIKRAVHRGKVDASGFPSPRTRLEGWERLAEPSRTTQRRPSPVPSLACPTLLLLPLLTLVC